MPNLLARLRFPVRQSCSGGSVGFGDVKDAHQDEQLQETITFIPKMIRSPAKREQVSYCEIKSI
ncbi:MAG: hypothetical protein A2539_01760 [Elusimicrobia bacterium RIFOXYD2_FULL_34_15]|nr:MAG: hypothetical protein A2539_01760 [Elusimicrobia bacterium RIFOXYD2_FULL_34_15]